MHNYLFSDIIDAGASVPDKTQEVSVRMTIKERIAARETLCGCHVHISDFQVTEILADMGYDMVWIDMEHL